VPAPMTCRTMKTVTAPLTMNVTVAMIERGDSRLTPQTPWPLVQPPPRLAPKPTMRPAPMRTAGDVAGRPWNGSRAVTRRSTPPATSPATKSARQRTSPRRGVRSPPTIPLTPAIRPFKSRSAAALRPITMPPKIGVAMVTAESRFRSSGADISRVGVVGGTRAAFALLGKTRVSRRESATRTRGRCRHG